jgi:hypothetical protein
VDPSGNVRTWVVSGTLQLPAGKTSVTTKAAVVDNAGKTGSATSANQPRRQRLVPAPRYGSTPLGGRMVR